VLCFSRAAEQGHPDGPWTDDGAVSTAGPGCRMLDAGRYCWMDCHGEATFHDKSFVHAFQTLARAKDKGRRTEK